MTGLPNKLAASFSEYADRLAPSPDYKQSILDDLTLTFLSIASAFTPKAIHNLRYIYGEADDQATIEKRDMDDAIVIVCESLQYIADLGNNLL